MKQIYEKEILEGQFDGMVPPKLKFSEILLTQKKTIVKEKKGEIISTDLDFIIKIKMKDGLKRPDEELGATIKEITGLSFVPYTYEDKSFNNYTNKYSGSLEEKKERLQAFFDAMTDYDQKREKTMESSSSEFENDIKNNSVINLPRFVMKYSKDLNCFVLLAKVRMEEDFAVVSNAAFVLFPFNKELKEDLFLNKKLYKEKVEYQSKLPLDFFDEFGLKSVKGKYVFLINEANYSKVKQFILKETNKIEEYKEQQVEASKEHEEDFKSLEVDDKNIFNFKLKYNKDALCFDFYCTGLSEPNDLTPKTEWMTKSVASIWAKNYILSEIKEENNAPFLFIDRSGYLENREKIELNKQIGSSLANKKLIIPLTDFKNIKKIKEKYDNVMEFWNRPESKILFGELKYYMAVTGAPLILFNKNVPYFVYKATSKAIESGGWKTTFFGKKISIKEARHFLYEHEMKDFIKEKSVDLNFKIHTKTDTLFPQKESFFNQLEMSAEVWEQSAKTKEKKKLKI